MTQSRIGAIAHFDELCKSIVERLPCEGAMVAWYDKNQKTLSGLGGAGIINGRRVRHFLQEWAYDPDANTAPFLLQLASQALVKAYSSRGSISSAGSAAEAHYLVTTDESIAYWIEDIESRKQTGEFSLMYSWYDRPVTLRNMRSIALLRATGVHEAELVGMLVLNNITAPTGGAWFEVAENAMKVRSIVGELANAVAEYINHPDIFPKVLVPQPRGGKAAPFSKAGYYLAAAFGTAGVLVVAAVGILQILHVLHLPLINLCFVLFVGSVWALVGFKAAKETIHGQEYEEEHEADYKKEEE